MDTQEDVELSALIKAQAKYYEAPANLHDKITRALDQASPANVRPAKHGTGWWRQGWGWGLAFAAGVLLSTGLTFFYTAPGQQDRWAEQVIDGHVRSLLAAHLTDVASSDQHTVKPWFSGKLDYSPPVLDLTAQGYPLVGGRLDYIDEHPVAALVYQHRLHIVNVFVWPVSGGAPTLPDATTKRGINVVAWRASGMQFSAVSDMNSKDLQEFSRLLQDAQQP